MPEERPHLNKRALFLLDPPTHNDELSRQIFLDKLSPEAPLGKLIENLLGLEPVLRWWTAGAVEGEVDDVDPPTGGEGFPKTATVGTTVFDVVPGIDDQDSMQAPGLDTRIVVGNLPRFHIAPPLPGGPFSHETHQLRLWIERQNLATFTYRGGEIGEEIPRARSKIGNGHPGLNLHQAHDRLRFLPSIPLRAIETLRPNFGVAKIVRHAVLFTVMITVLFTVIITITLTITLTLSTLPVFLPMVVAISMNIVMAISMNISMNIVMAISMNIVMTICITICMTLAMSGRIVHFLPAGGVRGRSVGEHEEQEG